MASPGIRIHVDFFSLVTFVNEKNKVKYITVEYIGKVYHPAYLYLTAHISSLVKFPKIIARTIKSVWFAQYASDLPELIDTI